MTSTKCAAFIFARGGSKGVPRKNIRPLAGRPLLAHSIEKARAAPSVGRVIVSTDDEEIAQIARQHGAEVPFLRPAELARDDSPEWLAWRHAIAAFEEQSGSLDIFLSLPPTSPLRSVEDIEACVSCLQRGDADAVISVTPSHRNPYFNMVTLSDRGYARVIMQTERAVSRRQDAPAVFDVTTVVYAARPRFVQEAGGLFEGRVKAVVVPNERALDIDTPFDFQIAELLLAQQLAQQDSEGCLMKRLAELRDLTNRVALITGGAGHLGSAMAEALAELGATVVVLDVNAAAADAVAQRVAEEFRVPTQSLAVDLEDDEHVARVPHEVESRFGRLDVLINNAAFYGVLEGWTVPFERQSVKAWRKVLNVNLTAAFGLSQACVPLLKASGKGAIVNISSLYGLVGPDMRIYAGTDMANPAVYSAGKAGTLQLTRWLATVLAPYIRVNSITPGGIFRNQPESFLAAYASRTPLQRMATEEDFKGATAYLASDLSSYMTGQNLILDGGWTAW